MKKMKSKIVLSNIQFLRAFAVIAIILHHSIYTAEIYQKPTFIFHFLKNWGTSSVDLFFVISGFIMVFIQYHYNKKPIPFLIDRVARVVPTYWFFSSVMIFILYFFPYLFNQMTYSSTWSFYSLFFISGAILDREPVIFVGWTLEYEMLFYFIFSISIFLRLQILYLISTSLFLIFFIYLFDTSLTVTNFIFGIVAGIIYTRFKINDILKKYLIFISIPFYLSTIWIVDDTEKHIYLYGIAAAILVYSAAISKQLFNKFFLIIGDRSYSIYLTQVFSIPAIFKFLSLFKNEIIPNDIIIIFTTVFTVLFGCIIFLIFENKSNLFYKKIKKK